MFENIGGFTLECINAGIIPLLMPSVGCESETESVCALNLFESIIEENDLYIHVYIDACIKAGLLRELMCLIHSESKTECYAARQILLNITSSYDNAHIKACIDAGILSELKDIYENGPFGDGNSIDMFYLIAHRGDKTCKKAVISTLVEMLYCDCNNRNNRNKAAELATYQLCGIYELFELKGIDNDIKTIGVEVGIVSALLMLLSTNFENECMLRNITVILESISRGDEVCKRVCVEEGVIPKLILLYEMNRGRKEIESCFNCNTINEFIYKTLKNIASHSDEYRQMAIDAGWRGWIG